MKIDTKVGIDTKIQTFNTWYNTKALLKLCLKLNLIPHKDKNGTPYLNLLLIVHGKRHFFYISLDDAAKELRSDKEGQISLLNALKEIGVEFKPPLKEGFTA